MTQVVNSSWRAGCVLFFYFGYHFHRGGNLGEKDYFICYAKEEAPFYLSILSKNMLAVGWSFILWSMLYFEG